MPPSLAALPWRYLVWGALLLGVGWYWASSHAGPPPQPLSYSEFKARVRDDAVMSVTLNGDHVTGTLRRQPQGKGSSAAPQTQKQQGAQPAQPSAVQNGKPAVAASPTQFVTTLPPINDPELIGLLEQHGVEIRAQSAQMSLWLRLIVGLLPWILFGGIIWYAGRRMRQRMAGAGGAEGIFGFGKSKAKRFRRDETHVRFDDVAGLEGAKNDLREIAGFLSEPGRYRKIGAKIPKGILLMGPPGTGKTLLARAVAGEAHVPFFSISGSEFIEMFVGVGASRVRDMFESAKHEAPAIIFIDEIDSVGRLRGTGVGGGNDEREQTLNQILGEMDGFAPHEAVVVLAATNRPDVLDPALLRPGRFDRKVALDLPDRKARAAILAIHSRDVSLADDVDFDRIAAKTVGFSGADMENLVNEAALLAGRANQDCVTMALFLSARDRIVLGTRRELAMSDDEKKLVAHHEAGHALVATLLPHADPLDKVTIIPRGQALGATEQIPEEDRHNLQESYLRDRIGVMLGGRVAEQIVFGERSTGAEQDLKQATQLARRMVTQWGMSKTLGPVAFRRGEEHIFLGREMTQQRDFSEHTAQVVDEEICELVRAIERRVTELLTVNRAQLDAVAAALFEQETLRKDEIAAIVESATAKRRRAKTG